MKQRTSKNTTEFTLCRILIFKGQTLKWGKQYNDYNPNTQKGEAHKPGVVDKPHSKKTALRG